MHRSRYRSWDGEKFVTRYRVWITAYENWQPEGCRDVPPEAVAVEPAEEGTMSARRAARYVQAYNRVALRQGSRLWAVALPVAIRYEGEPLAGQRLAAAPGQGPPRSPTERSASPPSAAH